MKPLFPVTDNCIYLNHAAVAPWPRPVAEAVQAFAEENLQWGSRHYPQWLETEQALRDKARLLLNAQSADDIALVKNTSEGLSFVAYGYPWQPGDKVVGIAQEFPSNRFVWQSLASKGVAFETLDLATLDDNTTPEQALIQLCDQRTRILAVSAVQYTHGFRLDLQQLGDFCRQRDILLCVDAIQQLGVIPFDVQACHADFVIADGHKWLLGPEGLGIFYAREEARDRLGLTQYGWRMAEDSGDYQATSFTPARSARRFECGSPNMLGIHALDAALGVLLDTGLESVWQQVSRKIDLLTEGLTSVPGLRILSNLEADRRSGILTFSTGAAKDAAIWQSFQDNHVMAAQRGGGLRLSPHFYTPDVQLKQLVNLVSET